MPYRQLTLKAPWSGQSGGCSAKLNGIDPQAWLADLLARLPDHPAKRVDELLPWHWRGRHQPVAP